MKALSAMEPMLVPEGHPELDDLIFELNSKASALSGALPVEVQRELGHPLRAVSCYYSNFLEGHPTHPRDIERALRSDFSQDRRQRALQLEARAHIEVQQLIDSRQDPAGLWPASEGYVRWLHREFCSRLPPEFLVTRAVDTHRDIPVVPGEFRTDRVVVGRHEPPPPATLADFMRRFTEAYCPVNLSKPRRLMSVAAAHHRFTWIHPFVDGNGRVARLMSHAMICRLLGANTLWSVSRGLARNADEYKAHLAGADQPRRNALDGRGALSLEELTRFCRFFLRVCIDQVDFMERLLQPGEILRRMELYVMDEIVARRLRKGSFEMLREAFYAGSVPRGKAPAITGYEERRARMTVAALLDRGLLVAAGPRAPVSLGFPAAVLERWLPNLYQ